MGLIAVAAVYIVLCFFGPKKFETSKSVVINADAPTVYSMVSDFNQWPQWSPWQKRDSLMKNTVTGAPSTVGHKMDWISESEGSGSLTIDEIVANQKVTTSLKMVDWDAISHASFLIEPAGDSTKLTWTMDGGDIAFGFRGLMVLMSAVSSIETDYTNGLNSIKTAAEAMPKQVQLSIEEITLSDQWYVGKRAVLPVTQLDSSYFSAIYGALVPALGDKIAGMPTSISHSYNMEKREIDLEVALPVSSEIKVEGYSTTMIPGGRAVKHVFVGPYEGTEKAWGQFMAQVNAKYKVRYSPYEVYANDPMEVKDPAKYITWMIVPVE